MREVFVEAENGSYAIKIERGLLPRLGAELKEMGISRAAVVTDETVNALYGAAAENSLREAGIQAKTIVLPAGEHTKSQKYLYQIYDELAAFGVHRADALVALGGGVIGDLAGFAAATYMRGIGFIQVPTTLLAQVDSSVGGKVAINLPYAKNIIGSFYQPNLVLIDTATLDSMDARQFAAGMAEVIKYAAIFDETMETMIRARDLEAIVCRSCEIKADYVRRDPFDKGCRMELNFGHTLGHCLEVQTDFSVLHGEGVAVGMAAMAKIGENKGITEPGTYDRLISLLDAFGLAHDPAIFDRETLEKTVNKDKKTEKSGVRAIFLERMGKAVAKTLPAAELIADWEALL